MSDSTAAKSSEYEFEWKPALAWLCMIGVFIFWMGGTGSNRVVTALMSTFVKGVDAGGFGWSTEFSATVSSMFVIVNAIAVWPMGIWATKKGVRGPGWLALITLLVGTALCLPCTADTPFLMLGARALSGVGFVMAPIMGVQLITEWFPEKHRNLPLGAITCAPSAASVYILQMSNVLRPAFGWRGVVYAELAVLIVALVFWIFFIKPGPGHDLFMKQKAAEEEARGEKVKITEVIKNPYIWMITAVYFVASMAVNGFNPFSNVIFQDNLGVDEATATNLSTLFQVACFIAPLLTGALVGPLGKWRTVVFPIMQMLYLIGLGLSFYFTSIFLVVGITILFTCFTTASAYCNQLLAIYCPSKSYLATATSLYSFIGMYVANICGQYVTAFAKSMSGNWAPVSAIIIGLGAVSVIIMFVLGRNLKKKIEAGECL